MDPESVFARDDATSFNLHRPSLPTDLTDSDAVSPQNHHKSENLVVAEPMNTNNDTENIGDETQKPFTSNIELPQHRIPIDHSSFALLEEGKLDGSNKDNDWAESLAVDIRSGPVTPIVSAMLPSPRMTPSALEADRASSSGVPKSPPVPLSCFQSAGDSNVIQDAYLSSSTLSSPPSVASESETEITAADSAMIKAKATANRRGQMIKRPTADKKAPRKPKKQKTGISPPAAQSTIKRKPGQRASFEPEWDVNETAGDASRPRSLKIVLKRKSKDPLTSRPSNLEGLRHPNKVAEEARMLQGAMSSESGRFTATGRIIPSYTDMFDYDDIDHSEEAVTQKGSALKGKKRQIARSKAPAGRLAKQEVTHGSPPLLLEKPRLSSAKGILAGSEADQWRYQRDGRWYEYQSSGCNGPRYSRWYRCTHCISKVKGDTCRFVNLRVFPLRGSSDNLSMPNPSDVDALEYAPFFADEVPRHVEFKYPTADSLFPPANAGSISAIKSTVAYSLLPTMEMELQHASMSETIWRNPELVIRPQCDFCLTSLFSASYCCRCCGKEYCLECSATIKEGSPVLRQGKDKVHTVHACTMRRYHSWEDLWPLTRFKVEELQDEVKEMKEASATPQTSSLLSENDLCNTRPSSSTIRQQKEMLISAPSDFPPLPERTDQWYKQLDGPTVDGAVGSHTLTEFEAEVDEATFVQAWAKGDPIIVHNCLPEEKPDGNPQDHDPGRQESNGSATSADSSWGPWSFCNAPWDEQRCYVTRCDADDVHKVVTVSDFFSTFGKSMEEKTHKLGKGIWKLKDWPPSSAFDDAFPDLYQHFNRALPVPSLSRRDGRMNISALFPSNANVPDLGPKMYNAWPSSEDQIGFGSTRLHMDIADAANIMYYAAKPSKPEELPIAHREGVAAWDIFPAVDAPKIRDYLRETREIQDFEDPIHSQKHFLDAGDRQRLWDTKGVRSWRIYQKAQDTIFIPAGCAHQVCNLTDCMKIAVDFVSPQNVARCFQLTAEFRALSNIKVRSWKEDVLQLKSMLWHAWRACREMDGHQYNLDHDKCHGSEVEPPKHQSKPFSDFAEPPQAVRRSFGPTEPRARRVREAE